jgi:hypothetical protein
MSGEHELSVQDFFKLGMAAAAHSAALKRQERSAEQDAEPAKDEAQA